MGSESEGGQFAVALQCSGHLRELCEGSNFEQLAQVVLECRQVARQCDLFVHTWRKLQAGTSTWSVEDVKALDLHTLSAACARRIDQELHPAALLTETQAEDAAQVVPALGSAVWYKPGTKAGQVALAGIRAAVHAANSVAAMRRSHELYRGAPYDLVVRIRPDVYRPLIARPTCWRVMLESVLSARARAVQAGRGRWNTTIWGCSKQLGRKNSDACFYGAAAAMDKFLADWEAVVDREARLHMCWQRQGLVLRPGKRKLLGGARRDSSYPSRARSLADIDARGPYARPPSDECGGRPAHLPETLLVPTLRAAGLKGRWHNCSASCACA